MSIRSIIRGASLFGHAGRRALRALSNNQPLLLAREPANPVDANAVQVRTLMGEDVGYVAREDAARIAPDIDRGMLWLCKVLTTPYILLWKEEPKQRAGRKVIVTTGAGTPVLIDVDIDK